MTRKSNVSVKWQLTAGVKKAAQGNWLIEGDHLVPGPCLSERRLLKLQGPSRY